MTCPACVGIKAWNDQLQRAYADILENEQRLAQKVLTEERKVEALARELREVKDELRIRRAATGYQPVLDRPSDD